MAKYNVNIKWGKTVFNDVELDTSQPLELFKGQLFALSGVPLERQKIMIPRGGQLKDDTKWETVKNLKDGLTIMLMGTADEVITAKGPVVFAEDLPETQAADVPVGLANTGNTCYLNSTLQVLRHIPELNSALTSYSDQGGNSLLKILSRLNNTLERKEDSFIPLVEFTTVFRQLYPQFAEQRNNHFEQQDAEECLSMILQSLHQVPSKNPKFDSIVSELFHGEYEVHMKCVEAEGEDDIFLEPFQKISCHIKQETNFLHSAIESSLSEHITKNSPTLGREAVYEKTRRIAKLPQYLVVQYVRFFWRQDTNKRAKICKPVEFPMKLDMFSFCTEELQKSLSVGRQAIVAAEEQALANRGKAKEEKPASSDVTMEDAKPEPGPEQSDSPPLEFENDTGFYQLSAVISHQGRDADGGHYVAWVRYKDDEWLLFDDNTVSFRTTEDVKRLTGHGGADWHIAYLCIYTSLLKKDLLAKIK